MAAFTVSSSFSFLLFVCDVVDSTKLTRMLELDRFALTPTGKTILRRKERMRAVHKHLYARMDVMRSALANERTRRPKFEIKTRRGGRRKAAAAAAATERDKQAGT